MGVIAVHILETFQIHDVRRETALSSMHPRCKITFMIRFNFFET